MANLSDWADELGVLMPGLTKLAAIQALKAVYREFCTESGAWRRELDPIEIISGQAWYTIDPQVDAKVLYILALGFMAEGKTEVSRYLTPMQVPEYQLRVASPSSDPWGYVGDPEMPGRFRLVPVISTEDVGDLIPWVALGPLDSLTEDVPDLFKTHFYDVILEGAAGRLMGQQDKPYTNIITAQYYLRRFRQGMAKARIHAQSQFTTAEADFLFPYWAGRSTRRH